MGRYVNPFEETATAGGMQAYSQPEDWGSKQTGGDSNKNQGTGETGDARSAHLKSEAEKSADQYLIGIAQAMQGMENAPLEIDPVTGQAIRAGGFKRDDLGQYFTDQITGVGDKGALLSDWERMQLASHQMDEGLGSMIATDDFGKPIFDSSGNVIYTGLGKAVKDDWGQVINAFAGEGDVSGQEYLGNLEDQYWSDRTAQDERSRMFEQRGGYGGGGGDGGGGYYGDPRTGNPIDRYGNFYTPQANLQQAMVNVHQTPTVFKKRGGIVSLLRLN